MSWLYSRVLVEEYSAVISSDGKPSALLKLTPTPQAYLSPDRMTVFSRLSRFGMMFAPLTGCLGAALLTWYLEAFLARISVAPAGGGGITGERSGLWKEMARIIGEVRPRYVLVENSPILTSRGLGTVLGDLAALGYDAKWGVLGAIDAGAPHLRYRIWIVAHATIRENDGRERRNMADQKASWEGINPSIVSSCQAIPHTESVTVRPGLFQNESPGKWRRRSSDGDSAGDISDAQITGLEGENGAPDTRTGDAWRRPLQQTQCDWWATEPGLGRVANGVAARVDRLKALGEGQVPAVVRIAWDTLIGG